VSRRKRPTRPSASRSAAPAPPSTRSGLVEVVVVALAASVAGIGNQFANDDLHLIQENVRIHDLGNVGEFFSQPFWPPPFSQDLYRPLTSLLLALEYLAGNGQPIVFRLVSYALYAAVAVGVLRLARRVIPGTPALAAALLFAAHPVHVEAVALGVAQNELVVAAITLFMVGRYFLLRASGVIAARQWGIFAILYLVAALLKEHALVIPGLLAAAELFLVRGRRREWRALAPGYLMLAAVAVGLLVLRREVLGGVAGTFVAEALVGVGVGQRMLTLLRIVAEWTRLLLWPAHLRLDYSPQEFVASTSFGPLEGLGAAMLVVAAWIVWRARVRAPLISFGLGWMAVALFPVSNVVVPTGVFIAERTLFLPSVGFALAFGGAVALLEPRFVDQRLRRAALTAFALLVVAGVGRSVERQRVWRHDGFLAVRSVQDSPRSFRAQRAYADVLFELRQPASARRAYEAAIALSPPSLTWRVRNDYARQLRSRDAREAEVEQLRASLAANQDQDDARGYLVSALLALGRYEEAAREADTARARGGRSEVFAGLRALADSARRAGAPPGSVIVQINPESARSR
jgi:hypothetical protein